MLVLLGWYLIELVQLLRQQQWRKDARKAGGRGFWPFFTACAAVAVAILILAPRFAPGLDIGHDAATFAVAMVLLVAGVALRVWSFRALGQLFTFTVKVSADQPVVTAGPYRVVRHPGYAGGLLAMIAIGAMYGNWLGLAAVFAMWLTIIVWRIRIEEKAMLAAIGPRYSAYAAQHKRLLPLVW
jgi:protein-S-isoprenylcysteine O-methyltransferase Ste14